MVVMERGREGGGRTEMEVGKSGIWSSLDAFLGFSEHWAWKWVVCL